MKRTAVVLAICLSLSITAACNRSPEEEVLSKYPSGKKQETAIYEGKEGNRARIKSFAYYESGERKKEFSHKDNHFFGPWTMWYKNGEKIGTGNIEVKALDHRSALGSGTYYWPGGAKMVEIALNKERSAADVVAVYDRKGTRYSAATCPPALKNEIRGILDGWEKGEL
jgi:hypothetical protein